jgi:hypothetical protein
MWEHEAGLEIIQQDALTQSGLLECYDIGTYEMQATWQKDIHPMPFIISHISHVPIS